MIPWRATYRLQLTPTFAFPEVERLLPYFARLGISHLYLSPILEARSGSAHGYDGVDPRVVRREFGGESAYRNLARAAHAAGLGLLVDIVPNHLAVSAEGEPFLDVLEKGVESRYAKWFDVDWASGPHPGRIAIPWLDPGRARNYRRYLDIDDLIGIRVEDDDVFAETHAKILELARDGLIDGLRIDHLDGLADPERYLGRLRAALPAAVAIFVESNEDWSEFGTTGYDALGAITASVLSRRHATAMEREFERAASEFRHAEERRAAIERVLDHELNAEFARIAANLREALGETASDPRSAVVHEVLRWPHPLARDPAFRGVIESREGARFVRYARSKAFEDTFLYRDVRVLARNELGVPFDETAPPWTSIETVCVRRSGRAPSLTPTSTHDTKRSEDARSRLVALARHASRFRALVETKREEFREHGSEIDPTDAWFVLQEWIAIRPHPATPEALHDAARRLEGVVVKAARESKLRTSWAAPDEAHESTLRRFVRHVSGDARLSASDDRSEPDEVDRLARQVADEGARVSLAQVLWKCLLPGIPDFYQGLETIRPLLVDPDNRGPVDFAPLVAALDAFEREDHLPRWNRLSRIRAEEQPGRLKHFVTRELLRFRSERVDFFERAGVEIRAVGGFGHLAPSALVFRRFDRRREVCAVVALDGPEELREQRPFRLATAEHLARREWFTDRVFDAGAEVSLADLLSPLGIALLLSE